MNPHQKALDSIFGDLDDLEQKKMFGPQEPDGDEGTSITITISPNGAVDKDVEAPEDDMNKGGEAYSEGGMVENPEDDKSLPPFLRKKKKA